MLCCSGERYRAIMALLFFCFFFVTLSRYQSVAGAVILELKLLTRPAYDLIFNGETYLFSLYVFKI